MNETTFMVIAALLLAVGLALCTFLFVTLKQEIHQLRKLARKGPLEVQGDLDRLREDMERIRAELARLESEVEHRVGELPQLSAPKPGMNTSRRAQVLRMYRRGERPEQIAAALGIARGEIDLLLKVHEIARSA